MLTARLRRHARRSIISIAVASAAGAGWAGLAGPAAAARTRASSCSALYVLFARGTTEAKPIGQVVGPDFTRAIQGTVTGAGVTVWGDPYAANIIQTSAGPGATLMTQELESVAGSCPNAKFVLGGYSQGASVVDIALGIKTLLGTGQTIPAADDAKLAAIVTFGNPLQGLRRQTIATIKPALAAITDEYCNAGDPVCGNGYDILAHLMYGINGDATAGGVFAATRYDAGD